jgi:hypothetical protein
MKKEAATTATQTQRGGDEMKARKKEKDACVWKGGKTIVGRVWKEKKRKTW